MSEEKNVSKLSTARFKLVHQRPYLASLLWNLNPVEIPGKKTLGIDARCNLYYDPEILDDWTEVQLTTVLYHEIMHILRGHYRRIGERDPQQWNLAGDAEINDDIMEEVLHKHTGDEFEFPGEPVLPSSFGEADGLLAETYYATLEKMKPPPDTSNGEGGDEKAKDKKGPAQGSCGGCAGNPNEAEDGLGSGDTPGKAGVEEYEVEILVQKVAKAIQEEIAQNGRGTIPGHLERWSEEKMKGKVNWKKQLATKVRAAIQNKTGKNDYTYRRPNRRSNPGIILPSTCSPLIDIGVIVDTSGSMDKAQLAQARAETERVLKDAGVPSVRFMSADASVNSIQKLSKASRMKLRGDGGTDMRVPMKAMHKEKPRPSICIIITDGITPWPTKELKGMTCIACVVGRGGIYRSDTSYYASKVPKWMQTVEVTVE